MQAALGAQEGKASCLEEQMKLSRERRERLQNLLYHLLIAVYLLKYLVLLRIKTIPEIEKGFVLSPLPTLTTFFTFPQPSGSGCLW